MLYCRGMSMTLITVAIDNEYKTQGVPRGNKKSRGPTRGGKIKGPIADDLC